ncbi:hypothetical protein M9H77_08601 [Catharanthus roseus]|uniref:Uncharacterized protein n=1 Tax=Catharanthus roseus TaxID=4058 RepID=A0ACC0BYL8_CATRO|nr:hypothetical protein M9H77_08601 [Catharanthus roseus]
MILAPINNLNSEQLEEVGSDFSFWDFETNPDKLGNRRENPFWKREDLEDAMLVLNDEVADVKQAKQGFKLEFNLLTCVKLLKGVEKIEEKAIDKNNRKKNEGRFLFLKLQTTDTPVAGASRTKEYMKKREHKEIDGEGGGLRCNQNGEGFGGGGGGEGGGLCFIIRMKKDMEKEELRSL